MTNLEAKCAACAKDIVGLAANQKPEDQKREARKLENELRKAAGILAEDGLYAFFIFLRYRKMDNLNRSWGHLATFLTEHKVGTFVGNFRDDEKAVITVTESLERLLFAKDMIRQILIYALYGLRAVR
jgi:hypothetical protein